MKDKKIKDAMRQYIETQTDSVLPSVNEGCVPPSLDEKVYAMIGAEKSKQKPSASWPLKRIGALAAIFVLVVGCGIAVVWPLHRENEHIAQDVYYAITISYENELYGYYSNRVVMDKYGIDNTSDFLQNPDLFTETLAETDIIQIQTDSIIDKDSLIGAGIYPHNDYVVIIHSNGQFYCFEKIVTDEP